MDHDTRRKLIGEVVHEVVCEHMKSDGFGGCAWYATVAAAVAPLCGEQGKWWPVAGSLRLAHDASDPDWGVGFLPVEDGLARGEYHCWAVRQDDLWLGSFYRPAVILDVSSRHYRALARLAVGPDSSRPWTVEEPPATLFAEGEEQLPGWVRLGLDLGATTALMDRVLCPNVRVVKQLASEAIRRFQQRATRAA